MASPPQELAPTSNDIDSLTNTYQKLNVAKENDSTASASSKAHSGRESSAYRGPSPVNGEPDHQLDIILIPNLSLNVKENDITAAFAKYAKDIESIRLQADEYDRKVQSATIKMRTPGIAQSAVQESAPLFLGNKLCFPSIGVTSPRDSRLRFGNGDLFIRNVSHSVKIADLYEMFSTVGELAGCVIVTYEDGTPRGFAYVSYCDRTLSDAAIAKFNGTTLGGREINVCYHLEKSPRNYSSDTNTNTFTNVFCRGIASTITEQDVVELFSTVGPLRSFSLPLNEVGESKGFAFINYKDHESAQNALSKLNGYRFKGNELSVTRAHNRETGGKSHSSKFAPGGYDPRFDYNAKHQQPNRLVSSALPNNIYIKGLSPDVTDEMLKDKFEEFGAILSTRIMSNSEGVSRGFGFVHYESNASATEAIKATNDTECWGTRIFVAPAQRREKRTNMRHHDYRNMPGYYSGMQTAMGQPPYMYMGMMMPNQAPYYGMYYNQDMPDNSQQNPYSAGSSQYMVPPWQMSWNQYNDYYLQMIGQNATQYRQMGLVATDSTHSLGDNDSASTAKSWIDYSNERRVKRQNDYAPSLAAAVASAENPEAEHQAIRDALYNSVVRNNAVSTPALAARITDVMLEGDKNELMHLIDNEHVLRVRILNLIETLESKKGAATDEGNN